MNQNIESIILTLPVIFRYENEEDEELGITKNDIVETRVRIDSIVGYNDCIEDNRKCVSLKLYDGRGFIVQMTSDELDVILKKHGFVIENYVDNLDKFIESL